jgi:uncharacterized iron-regulated protein
MAFPSNNRYMIRTSVIIGITLALALVLLPKDAAEVYRVSDGGTLSVEKMVQELRTVDVIFIGELHDSPGNHLLEGQVIQMLHEAGVPLAVGLEMFRADDQGTLDAWTAGALPLDQFLPRYYANWRMPWPLYKDIFLYAREHRIPLIGLNIPDAVSKAVAQKGFGSLSAAERQQIPSGITCDVDARYREFIRRAYSDHIHPSDRNFNNFCEAQLVWDRSMAWHIAQFRTQHKDTVVVVLTGVGHAWRRGIPEQLTRYAKLHSRIVLPAVPGDLERSTVTSEDADYLVGK